MVVGDTGSLPLVGTPAPSNWQEAAFVQVQESVDCPGGTICWGLAPKVQLGGLDGGGGGGAAPTVKVTVTVCSGGLGCEVGGDDVALKIPVPVYVPAASPLEFAVRVRY